MRTQSAPSTTYTSAAFIARRRVEKANSAKRLGREDRRKTDASTAAPRFREHAAASRFETNRRSSDCEIRPIAGFVAQIIGQMMGPECHDAREAARAYVHAGSGGARPLSHKYV